MSGLLGAKSPAGPVSVHIDVVSVQAVSLTATQVGRFQVAFEHELARLATHELRPASLEPGARPLVITAPMHLDADMPPSRLGREVGRRVWDALLGVGYSTEWLVP